MATNFINNTYSGEVLDTILAYAVEGNDTFDKGLVKIQSGIQHKYVLPTIQVGDVIQANKATPVSPTDSKGDVNINERVLAPGDFMVYAEFNPRDYEVFWKPFQPDGNLVFRELDPKVQATIAREIMKQKNKYLGDALWVSRSVSAIGTPTPSDPLGATGYQYFNGFLHRILDADKGAVINSGQGALTTKDEVFAAMAVMYKDVPKAMRGSKKMKYVMDWATADLYEDYRILQDYKGIETTENTILKYRGIPVVPINGMLDETIVLGEFGADMLSNFWVGVDYANDTEVLKVERLQANSEVYFFQMRMKMDTNVVRPKEIVVYSKYKFA